MSYFCPWKGLIFGQNKQIEVFVLGKAVFSDKNGGGKHCVHKYTTFRGYIIIETLIHEYGLGVDEG